MRGEILLMNNQRTPSESARRTITQFRFVLEPNIAKSALDHLEISLINLQCACAISSELIVIPETRRLPGLHQLHSKAFVPMSYHIVTALGALRVILTSEPKSTLSFLAVSCIINTLDAAKNIAPNIREMREHVSPKYCKSVEVANQFAHACVKEVQEALEVVKNYSIGAPNWPSILKDIRLFQQEVRRIRREEVKEGY
jgi:hypothetical protein